jgi:hypothetical protein
MHSLTLQVYLFNGEEIYCSDLTLYGSIVYAMHKTMYL